MHKIEAARRQLRSIGIAKRELDIARRPLARVRNEDGVGIEADHAPGLADALAQQQRDSARPTAEIEAMPACTDTDAVKHDFAIMGDRGGLDVQPFDFAGAALDGIVSGTFRTHRGDPFYHTGRPFLRYRNSAHDGTCADGYPA